MEFTLYYRGPLTSQGNALDKHCLRRHFHGQLKELWSHPPLIQNFDLIDPDFEPTDPRGGFATIGEKPSVVDTVGA